jgi:HSP20 family protein
MILSGEYLQEKKDKTPSKFYYGKLERAIGFPVAVQNDKVEADFSDGILTPLLLLPVKND